MSDTRLRAVAWACLARDSFNARIEGLYQGDVLLDHFLSELQAVCTEAQLERFTRVPRMIRCLSSLRRGNFSGNLYELLEDAMSDSGVLSSLDDGHAAAEILDVLLEYEVRVDLAIKSFVASRRKKRPRDYDSGPRMIDHDHPTPERQSTLTRIRIWLDAMETSVLAIGQIAEANLGEAARDEWIGTWHRSIMPELFAEWWPDRLLEWVNALPGVTESEIAVSEVIHSDYRRERDVLREQGVSRTLRAMKRYGSLVEGRKQEQVAVVSTRKRMRELIKRTMDRLRGALTAEHRDDFETELWGIRAAGGRLLGPKQYQTPE